MGRTAKATTGCSHSGTTFVEESHSMLGVRNSSNNYLRLPGVTRRGCSAFHRPAIYLAEVMSVSVLMSNPFRDVISDSPYPLLLTLGLAGQHLSWCLDGPIGDLDPVQFSPCRCGSAYPHRQNYSGTYPFGLGRRMVMFESLLELTCLMELDHGGEVEDISAQPFCLLFCDGTKHYPDFAARLRDGGTAIIDVKPLEFATKDAFVHRAVLTEAACATQRWEYRVMHGCQGWQAGNLEWMCAFRYDEYLPDPVLAKDVIAFLAVPRSMEEAALRLDPRMELGVGYALLSNMMFHRLVVPAEPGPFYPGLMVIAGAGVVELVDQGVHSRMGWLRR